MLARQSRDGADTSSASFASGSIAVSSIQMERRAADFLVTIGTPLRAVSLAQIADSASAARSLAEQDGAFASIFWSDAERRLVVVTDFLGFKPLYMRRTRGRLQLSSDTKAWDRPPDPAGWGAFVSFGHTIGDRTLLEGVKRVGAATVLVYDAETDQLTECVYWHWPRPARTPDIAGLVEALRDSATQYAARGGPGTLLLSGGFDSRLIACILAREGIPFQALGVSHADQYFDADGRFAGTFARRQGLRFRLVRSPRDFFSSEAYLDYLFDTDASTPSLYLFISQVAQFVDATPVWEGLVPGYTLTTPHQPAGGFAEYIRRECAARESTAWRDARSVFRQDFCEAMLEGFEADLGTDASRYPDNGNGVSEFIIRNRARNRTGINPLKVYEARTHAFLPGLTRAYVDLAGSVSESPRLL